MYKYLHMYIDLETFFLYSQGDKGDMGEEGVKGDMGMMGMEGDNVSDSL